MNTPTIVITAFLCGTSTLNVNSNQQVYDNNVISSSLSTFKSINNTHVVNSVNKNNSLDVSTWGALNNELSIYYTTGGMKMKALEIQGMRYRDKELKFKNKYFIPFYQKDNHYYADDSMLEVFCCGEDINSLIDDIKESLIVSWQLYVDCDEAELSEDAKDFKTVLTNYLELV